MDTAPTPTAPTRSISTSAEPLLTAALIARDEEEHLPRCLGSLAGLVDEIVVVDTGSDDDTVAIARAFGATVVETDWQEDFSVPRNLALQHASGRWVLSIDADEWIEQAPPLGELLAADGIAAYMVLLRPARGYTPYRECRLFRNAPEARFDGRIHERILPSLAGVGAVARCPLLIGHSGYDGVGLAKARRDLPLLAAHLEEAPHELDQWRRLAEAAAAAGETARARSAFETAVRLAREGAGAGPAASLAYSGYAQFLLATGEDVGELLAEGLERFPTNHLLAWLRARTETDEGALEWWERLAAVDVERLPDDGISYDERLFGAVALSGLAGCLFRLGRHAESAEAYERAATVAPEDLEIRAKGALAAARAGSLVAA